MGSATYDLVIRARPDEPFDPDPGALAGRLERIPGVTIEGPQHFAFGERDEHGRMEIVAEEGGRIAISIPRPWVMDRGPQVFALVFMAAEWCGGEVFDPQIDDTLRKEVVLQGLVAVRQAQREREATAKEPAVPPASASGPHSNAEKEVKRPWWKPGS
jgi:hypothetical protein